MENETAAGGEPGYAGKILRIDLSTREIVHVPTKDYATRFLGGRGIAAKIYWDEVPPEVGPFDPENRLLILTGPLAGFPGLASSRWQICAKSPAVDPEHFCYANLGGTWGVQLKFAGYDGVVIYGKSPKPVYIFIQDGKVEIRDGAAYWGKGAIASREAIRADLGESARVLAIGPGGENLVRFAALLAEKGASASCGMGAVMGSKNLKAIVVEGSKRVRAANPERLRDLVGRIRQYSGYAMLKIANLDAPGVKRDPCFGCTWDCIRLTYRAKDGTSGKYMCQASWFYQARAYQYYGAANDVPFRATRLCDDYGLDTNVVESIIFWLSRCHKGGSLNDDNTGMPLSRMGSLEFIETLVRKVALRDGFGEILAHGPEKAARIVGKGTLDFITDYMLKAGQNSYYDGRMFVTTGLLYAMEPRQPIQQLHEVSGPVLRWVQWASGMEGAKLSSTVLRSIAGRFWGSELAADLSTYEGKALAARKIQDRQYAKESLILCDFAWPVLYAENTDDHVGDPTLESQLLSAVCGKEVDEQGLYDLGERIFNLQRAILIREGHGGRDDDRLPERFYTIPLKEPYPQRSNPLCLAPGRGGEIISRKGEVVDREGFEAMKTEYYQLRGWDPSTGLQRRRQLAEVGLADIGEEMEALGLLSQT